MCTAGSAIPFSATAQDDGFNKRVYLESRSTRFENVIWHHDSLIITGQIGTDSLGLAGFFVMVMDTFGNIGRIKYFRDPSLKDHTLLDGRNPVIINRRGNLVLAGVFLSRDDLFFRELNSNLETILYREYESNYKTMYAHDVIELHDGYYIIGIVQKQTFDLDIWVQRIDMQGNKIWEKTYGITSYDEGSTSAIIENDGITMLTFATYDLDKRDWTRLIHIDSSGDIEWQWSEEVTGLEGPVGPLLKVNDNYVYSSFLKGEYVAGTYRGAPQIVMRDADFNVVWRTNYGEPTLWFNTFRDMVLCEDGTLIGTGQMYEPEINVLWGRVMKVDMTGEVLWEVRDTGFWRPGKESINHMRGIVELPGGSVIAVGHTKSFMYGHHHGLILKVTKDGCIDTLCTTVAVDDMLFNEFEHVVVYPNPVTNAVTFELPESWRYRDTWVVISDGTGREVFRADFLSQVNTLDISSALASGLYFYHVIGDGEVVDVGKVVVVVR